MALYGILCGTRKYLVDSSLLEFAEKRRDQRGGWAWHMGLDDETFNEVWDALHNDRGIGARTIACWLNSKGYEDATEGKVKTVRLAKRR